MQTTIRQAENQLIVQELSRRKPSVAIVTVVGVRETLLTGPASQPIYFRERLLPSQATVILYLLGIQETAALLSSGSLEMAILKPITSDQLRTLSSILKDFALITARIENEAFGKAWFDHVSDWDLD